MKSAWDGYLIYLMTLAEHRDNDKSILGLELIEKSKAYPANRRELLLNLKGNTNKGIKKEIAFYLQKFTTAIFLECLRMEVHDYQKNNEFVPQSLPEIDEP